MIEYKTKSAFADRRIRDNLRHALQTCADTYNPGKSVVIVIGHGASKFINFVGAKIRLGKNRRFLPNSLGIPQPMARINLPRKFFAEFHRFAVAVTQLIYKYHIPLLRRYLTGCLVFCIFIAHQTKQSVNIGDDGNFLPNAFRDAAFARLGVYIQTRLPGMNWIIAHLR